MYKYLFTLTAVVALTATSAEARSLSYNPHTDMKTMNYGMHGDLIKAEHKRMHNGTDLYHEAYKEQRINFDFDKAKLPRHENGHTLKKVTLDSKDYNEVTLDNWAKYLKDNPETNAFLVGNTDPKGTHKYNNEKLAPKRAATAKAELVARGISADRLHEVSDGEMNLEFAADHMNRNVDIDVQD